MSNYATKNNFEMLVPTDFENISDLGQATSVLDFSENNPFHYTTHGL